MAGKTIVPRTVRKLVKEVAESVASGWDMKVCQIGYEADGDKKVAVIRAKRVRSVIEICWRISLKDPEGYSLVELVDIMRNLFDEKAKATCALFEKK